MNRLILLLLALILPSETGLSSVAAAADLQGVVVRAGGAEPVTKANVTLQGISENSRILGAITSDAGRFMIRGVPPGKYAMTVTRPGYVRSDRSLTLNEDPRTRNVSVTLKPTGAISGRIFDESGEPVAGAEVRAMKSYYQQGGRVLVPMQSTVTDDRGEYRLFWLPPGRYFVSAIGPRGATTTGSLNDARGDFVEYQYQILLPRTYSPNPTAPIPQPETATQEAELYVPVYFRSATEPQGASPIEVRPDATAAGIDLTVERVRKHRIRGTVVDARTGAVLRNSQTQRVDDPPSYIEDEALLSSAGNFPVGGTPHPTGEFEWRDVVSGKYLLFAQSGDMTGRVAVELRDADLENVVIPVMPGFNIAGHITIQGGNAPKDEPGLPKLEVRLRRDPYIPVEGTRRDTPAADGSFKLKNIPAGDYRVLVDFLPEGYYIESIRRQTADVLNDGLHINGQSDGQMDIVLGNNPGTLTGTVRGEKRQPIPNARVVLVPDHRNRVDLFKTARAGESGEFRFESVTPGDYKLFAWEDIDDGAWLDPDLMEPYESRGAEIAVGLASDQSMTIGVIR